MWVPFSDVIICARFYLYRPKYFSGEGGGVGLPKLAVPIELKGHLYNS